MSNFNVGAPSQRLSPASLNFLAIYCPSLGTTETTEQDQIVFYHCGDVFAPSSSRTSHSSQGRENSHKNKDEQLRQIGLAQGIVNFARTFSNDESVNSVETERHRIVVSELEPGWWILASINLTRLPSSTSNTTGPDVSKTPASFEYSSREVSPPALLLQQLLRAHSILLLHHGPTLSDLYTRLSRFRFCNLLHQFWSPFADKWDVMLHGNPTLDVYNGIKLAAGGELGVGVGEEGWGSGERAVLEDLVHRTEGLVDMFVARFGDIPQESEAENHNDSTEIAKANSVKQWLGGLEQPNPSDGLIFTGVGALSRSSLRSLAAWIRDVFTYGEDTYGVRDNPGAGRPRRSNKDKSLAADEDYQSPEQESAPAATAAKCVTAGSRLHMFPKTAGQVQVPPPLVDTVEDSLRHATASADAAQAIKIDSLAEQNRKHGSAFADPDVWVKYLTLGASTWFTKSQQHTGVESDHPIQIEDQSTKSPRQCDASVEDDNVTPSRTIRRDSLASVGSQPCSAARFLIGLEGGLDGPSAEYVKSDSASERGMNDRKRLRTVHVEINIQHLLRTEQDEECVLSENSDASVASHVTPEQLTESKRLRVIVYIHQPFVFTLLFEPNEHSLSMTTFFHDLHRHLSTLHKPLLESTAIANVAERFQNNLDHLNHQMSPVHQTNPVFHLIYDPLNFTVHSSIPNIPLRASFVADGFQDSLTQEASWTRLEALNVHAQILNNFAVTRRCSGDRERTSKTSRGFWTVWMQLPATFTSALACDSDTPVGNCKTRSISFPLYENQLSHPREAILIRRAVEFNTSRSKAHTSNGTETASSWGGWLGRESIDTGSELYSSNTSTKLADSIGIDTRKYIYSLLSLN